jgi:hypothetical protein
VIPNSPANLPYYPLHDYRLVWNLLDERGKAVLNGDRKLAQVSQAEQLSGVLPAEAAGHSPHLVLKLLDSTGAVAAERELEWPAAK